MILLDFCDRISFHNFPDLLNYSSVLGLFKKAYLLKYVNNFCSSDYLSCVQNDCKVITQLFPLPSVN